MRPTRYFVTIDWRRGSQFDEIQVPQVVRVRLPEESVETAEVDLLSNEAPVRPSVHSPVTKTRMILHSMKEGCGRASILR